MVLAASRRSLHSLNSTYASNMQAAGAATLEIQVSDALEHMHCHTIAMLFTSWLARHSRHRSAMTFAPVLP